MSDEPVEYLFSSVRPTQALRESILNEVAILEDNKQRNLEITSQNEEILASLKREELLLNEESLRRYAHISPIRWVPFEILGGIFKFYIEDNSKAIAHLQLVCKSWQYVIKKTPHLWTKIELVGPFHLEHLNLHKRHIDSHILSSGKLPLRIIFRDGLGVWKSYGTKHQDNIINEATIKLLEYLALHANKRWRSLDIWCGFNDAHWQGRARAIYPAMLRASKLQHLTIHANPVTLFTNDRDQGISSLLSDLYSKDAGPTTIDLYDIGFYFHNKLSPLNSVQVLSIGFTAEWKWDHLLEGTADRSWLSMFPQLRKLTLNASKAMFMPSPLSNVAGMDPRTSLLYEEYEATKLVELCLHGPAPPWVLHNVTFPALKTLVIEANWRSSHALDDAEKWDGIYLGPIQDLYILCSKCSELWRTDKGDDDLTMYLNQVRMHGPLSRFLDVESVHARSCFWRQIDDVFDPHNSEVCEAARGACPDLHTVSGDSWRSILEEIGKPLPKFDSDYDDSS